MAIAKANRKLMREINNRQVLQQIRMNGPISRPELSEVTGLGLSTISNIVSELIENQLVREVGEGDSSGGRRPSMLDINEQARYAFGVKIGPENVWISLFDLHAHQIDFMELTFSKENQPEELFSKISSVIENLRTKHKILKRSILGIGVSTSGLIDAETGVCLYSPLLGWNDIPVRQRLVELTRLNVIVENDVNAFAYGTLFGDANPLVNNMICITTGPGVGAGIILNRNLYRGSRGGAGEFGHTSIDRYGPVCNCGRNGCLDVLASDQFLMAGAKELIKTGKSSILQGIWSDNRLSPTTIFFAAQVGDEGAKELYRRLGENLGYGVANLINLFNPDKIVIGGEGAVASKFFLDSLRDIAMNHTFPHLADDLEIVVDDGSEDVWLQGAAMLVIERFFEIPLEN